MTRLLVPSPVTVTAPLPRGVYRGTDPLAPHLVRWLIVDSTGEAVGEVRLRARYATPETDERLVQILDDHDRVSLALMRDDFPRTS